VAVGEQVVGAPREREPAAGEPDELQRQREAALERHGEAGERAVGVGEVDVRQPRRGLRHHELRAGVVAGDTGHAGGGVGHDAADEGEEAGEEGRQGGARGRGDGGEARGPGRGR